VKSWLECCEALALVLDGYGKAAMSGCWLTVREAYDRDCDGGAIREGDPSR